MKRFVKSCARTGITLVTAGIAAAGMLAAVTAAPANAATLPSGSVQVFSASSGFAVSSSRTVKANCPTGQRVLGGSGVIAGATHVVFTEMQPLSTSAGDGYEVTAVAGQAGESASWAVTAHAYCTSAARPGLRIVSATTPLEQNLFFSSLTVHCPVNTNLVGTGGQINGGAGQVNLATEANDTTTATAAGWGDTDGFTGNWSVTAFAVCMPLNSPLDVRVVANQTPSPAAPVDSTSVSATCPSGTQATDGAAWASAFGHVVSVAPNKAVAPFTIKAVGRSVPPSAYSLLVWAICVS